MKVKNILCVKCKDKIRKGWVKEKKAFRLKEKLKNKVATIMEDGKVIITKKL